jgi:hypothetical protein
MVLWPLHYPFLLSHAKAFITQRLPGRVNTFLKGCGLQPFFGAGRARKNTDRFFTFPDL